MQLIRRALLCVAKNLSRNQLNRYAQAVVAGIVLTLAYPPFKLWMMTIPAFLIMWRLLEKETAPKITAKTALLFGYSHYLTSCYWITNSLLTDPARFWWLVPPTLVFMPLWLALHQLPAWLIYTRFHHLRLSTRLLWFTLLWVCGEYVRRHYFIPFPWLLVGDASVGNESLLLLTRLGGAAWNSYIIILFAASLYLALRIHKRFVLLTLAIVAGVLIHTRFVPTPSPELPLSLSLVQATAHPDEQTIRMQGGEAAQAVWMIKQRKLQMLTLSSSADIIIWPEAQLRLPIALKGSQAETRLWPALESSHQRLIAGAVTIDSQQGAAWNSLYVMNNESIIARYDKSRLTPFGEYIPWPFSLLPLPVITSISTQYGTGLKLLPLKDEYNFLPLICYEDVFGHEVQTAVKAKRPELLVSISNDAWFGNSAGPYQHLAYAQLRAAELGLPLARVANTGITAIIDARGNIVKQIDLFKTSILNINTPGSTEPTYYAQYGELLWLITWFIGVLLAFGATLQQCFFSKVRKSPPYN